MPRAGACFAGTERCRPLRLFKYISISEASLAGDCLGRNKEEELECRIFLPSGDMAVRRSARVVDGDNIEVEADGMR